MKTINTYEVSLGLGTFDDLGFKSEEELNHEIAKLVKVRPELEVKSKINFN